MDTEKVTSLAPDLTKISPRSPRAPLGPYQVLAARALDKCRAELVGTSGSYHFNCPLDQQFFKFSGIDSGRFKSFVASGATDEEVAHWLEQESKIKDPAKIAAWARRFRMNPITLVLDFDDWLHRRKNQAR